LYKINFGLINYRKRSLKVTFEIDEKIGMLGSSKIIVKLTKFLLYLHVKLDNFLNKITVYRQSSVAIYSVIKKNNRFSLNLTMNFDYNITHQFIQLA
jgi:hypothetical protein